MASVRNFKFVILVIGFALVGLIAIQVYWIRNAVETEQEQLEHHVNAALSNVVIKLDRRDYSRNILSHKEIQEVVHDIHHRVEHSADVITKNVQIIDSIITREDGESISVQIVRGSAEDSSNGIRAETRVVREGLSLDSIPIMMSPEGDLTKVKDHLNTLVVGKDELVRRIHLISDILIEVFDEESYAPVEKRIDVSELDSMLESELAQFGIDSDFEFAICNNEGHCYNFKEEAPKRYSANLNNPAFKTNLFPDDLMRTQAAGTMLLFNLSNDTTYILKQIWWILALSLLFIGLIIYAFYFTVSTIYRQKKLSVIKNDFINNMTHELKTPISTISLACEALSDPDISQADQTRTSYLGMIKEENSRLGMLVERVLQSAVIEKGELKLNLEPLRLNELVSDVARRFKLKVEKRGGQISLNLDADPDSIRGDQVHITNVLYNLFDNALKYTDTAPDIKARTYTRGGLVYFEIKDNGIGIHKEYQAKIFDNLFRVPTGNVHDVKGFGIGLSYVKAIIDNHGGDIEVVSSLGEGSTFTVKLPKQGI